MGQNYHRRYPQNKKDVEEKVRTFQTKNNQYKTEKSEE